MAISVDVAVGRPPVEVVRTVQESGHDLVILWSDDSDDSRAIMRHVSHLPVSSLGPAPPGGSRSRVAAIDPDDDPSSPASSWSWLPPRPNTRR